MFTVLVALHIQAYVNDAQRYLCDMLRTVTSHKTRMLLWAYKENEPLAPTLFEEMRFLSV